MSIDLPDSGLEAKTHGEPFVANGIAEVRIGNVEMTMRDFCLVVEYALTNTDLVPNDPRIALMDRLKTCAYTGRGENEGANRIRFTR